MHSQRIKPWTGIVLDFDGTMNFLFRNYDLSETIKTLNTKLQFWDVDFKTNSDAFDVFQIISKQLSQNSKARIQAYTCADTILANAEMMAVETCAIVPGFSETIRLIHEKGYKIGVSTNNSERCVRRFLHRIIPEFEFEISVAGRIGNHPEWMKPNMWSIKNVAAQIGTTTKELLFVGDSASDYIASKNAMCDFVGMAATPSKKEKLLNILPEQQIVSDFYELLSYLDRFS